MAFLRNKLGIRILLSVALNASFVDVAIADGWDFLKGCLIMGGVGVGGTTTAASLSGAELKDTTALVVSGVTSCLIGGVLANDTVKRAEMDASRELQGKNSILKNRIYGVMHDLCVMKGECGPDGKPKGIQKSTDPFAKDGGLDIKGEVKGEGKGEGKVKDLNSSN